MFVKDAVKVIVRFYSYKNSVTTAFSDSRHIQSRIQPLMLHAPDIKTSAT